MSYLALTQATASWILGKAGLIDALHEYFVLGSVESNFGAGCEFVEGPFRMAWSENKNAAMWNADYLSGTDDEPWGFIRLDGDQALRSELAISREVFERCIYVISQRLQGLTINGTLFPRAYPSGAHTCLAGRGTDARQSSIGYFETHIGDNSIKQQAIVCIGPEQNWRLIDAGTVNAGKELSALVKEANKLIAPGRKAEIAKPEVLSKIRSFLAPFSQMDGDGDKDHVDITVLPTDISGSARHGVSGLTYEDWLKTDSPLTAIQRRILESDGINKHPIRILGPGGSGKTLLLQLLALRRLREAAARGETIRVLYIVHNHAMAQSVKQRFDILMSDHLLEMQSDTLLEVKTLSQIAREQLNLEAAQVIDIDAQGAKDFQFDAVKESLRKIFDEQPIVVSDSPLLSAARDDSAAFVLIAILAMADISIAIKGHGLEREKKKYVQSARSLSRFHGLLSESERSLIFDVFQAYHHEVFEKMEVLDSDDLAISLLGRLRTPIWELRRRHLGFDHIFVDETQLFNENERRLIPLLTNNLRDFVPVVLALDEAQAVYGQTTAGFAALGIEGISNENLGSIHRSTKAIVDLAFFVIQRSTDLFGPDFPDFTDIANHLQPENHPLAAKPRVEFAQDEKQGLGKFVLKRVRELRRANIRQIAVVVHVEQYWDVVATALRQAELPLQMLLTRGERLPHDKPLVVLTKPAFVGGQEFDAVIIIGLEQGLIPPKFPDNGALSSAMEQQALREIYLSLTRARFQVIVAVAFGAAVSGIIGEAAKNGLIDLGKQP